MLVPKENYSDIKPSLSLSHLLKEEGDRFLICVYLTLLKRHPDANGLAYYGELLKSGESKSKIIAEIASSVEARSFKPFLPGIDRLIVVERFKGIFRSKRKTSIIAEGDLPQQPLLPPVDQTNTDVSQRGYERVCVAAKFVELSDYIESCRQNNSTFMNSKIWFDLTTSMEWTGGVVGIIRAELEVAAGLKKLHPTMRYVMQLGTGFVEIPHQELTWLLSSDNVADAYMKFFARYSDRASDIKPGLVKLNIPEAGALYHPFSQGDAIIAMGWMESEKENYYAKVKAQLPDMYLCYLVYDTILLNDETRRFYPMDGRERFAKYLKWVSDHCDLILFGGSTAQRDTEAIQRKNLWPVRPGFPIKFGTDIVKTSSFGDEDKVLESLGIHGDFFMTVGSLEPRKNHDTLYRAFLMSMELDEAVLPQLVIVGKPMWRVGDLVDSIDRDPRVKGRIVRLTPTDQELALLYKRCLFTVLPSLYEGWSLTLPESLGQGKFCIVADTPPLKEIGGELIDYVSGWDVRGWADKILYFSRHRDQLLLKEKHIQDDWPNTAWIDAAKMIYDGVKHYVTTQPTRKLEPEIWIDLTTSYLHWQGGISGIIRAELTFARNIFAFSPNVHFFAYDAGNFFEIRTDLLLWLLNDLDLATQYQMFQDYWREHESRGSGHRNPFTASGGVYSGHPAILQEFPSNSIFLFCAIDFGGMEDSSRMTRISEIAKHHERLMLAQIIYDFTPILYPQLHLPSTCAGYGPFVESSYQNFDCLIFGGQTALRDGERLRKAAGWKEPITGYIEFGSDVTGQKAEEIDLIEDHSVLKRLGVGKNFVMTVGTIEPRKNHEMLYKAFLLLREQGIDHLPKLVIVGKPGWKTEDFRAILEADDRVKDLVIVISPSDEELDVLYRYCKFTLLPSFYEGWSLTLPESLSYGKFCLVSDSEPLKETGRDLVEYVHPLDTCAWVDRIKYYVENPNELARKEARIRAEWHPKSWMECSRELVSQLIAAYHSKYDVEKPVKLS